MCVSGKHSKKLPKTSLRFRRAISFLFIFSVLLNKSRSFSSLSLFCTRNFSLSFLLMMTTRPPPSPSSSTPSEIESGLSSSSTSNARITYHRNSFPFIPRQLSQSFKAVLPFPRLYSGPLFAAPSVSVSHTHIVSNSSSSSVGPLTPPLTIDSFPTPSSDQHISTNPSTLMDPSNKLRMLVISQQKQQQQPWIRKQPFQVGDVVHDMYCCMFRITLDSKGTMGKRDSMYHLHHAEFSHTYIIAALCYLPTRFQKMIEFYHTVSLYMRERKKKKAHVVSLFRKSRWHTEI